MMNATTEQPQTAKQAAGGYFKEGYNCAEAILRAFRQELDLDLSDDALKMATGFGGGIGHAGCVCGALAASVMVLGILNGRADNKRSLEPIYKIDNEFQHRFTEKFGGSCCRVLNRHPFNSKDHLRNCLKLTGSTAELLMNYIEEKKLH